MNKNDSHNRTVNGVLSKGKVVENSFDRNNSDKKITEINKMSDSSDCRDRLGLWGMSSDSEVPGTVSGLDRLRNGRYNKVILINLFFFILHSHRPNSVRRLNFLNNIFFSLFNFNSFA